MQTTKDARLIRARSPPTVGVLPRVYCAFRSTCTSTARRTDENIWNVFGPNYHRKDVEHSPALSLIVAKNPQVSSTRCRLTVASKTFHTHSRLPSSRLTTRSGTAGREDNLSSEKDTETQLLRPFPHILMWQRKNFMFPPTANKPRFTDTKKDYTDAQSWVIQPGLLPRSTTTCHWISVASFGKHHWPHIFWASDTWQTYCSSGSHRTHSISPFVPLTYQF